MYNHKEMIFIRSNVFLSTLFFTFLVISTICCDLGVSEEEAHDLAVLMRRGIGDQPQKHLGQGSQSGHQSTSAAQHQTVTSHQEHMPMNPQHLMHAQLSGQMASSSQHPQHHAQLRDILYHQAARGGISPTSHSLHQPTRYTRSTSAKFDLVAVPDGLQDHEARAHVQNIQSKAYAGGHRLKGHAVIQVPANHEANHDLPKVTIHSGRKAGLVHTSFLKAQSPPRQQQEAQTHIQQRHPGSSFAHPAAQQPAQRFQLTGYTSPSPAHTHVETTANLLDRVSGQPQSQLITQHTGDKRHEGSSHDHVDTTLRLRKRSVEGEKKVEQSQFSKIFTDPGTDHFQYLSFEKRASSNDESSGKHPFLDKGYIRDSDTESETTRDADSKYINSHSTIRRLKHDGHKIKGISDIGITSDKTATNLLPHIQVKSGRMRGHVLSWITTSPESARKRDKIKSRMRKERYTTLPRTRYKSYSERRHGYFQKPHANKETSSPEKYKSGFIETNSPSAESRIKDKVERRLERSHQLSKIKVSQTFGRGYSDHALPALHIMPGQTKARVTSAFFHRERSPDSTPRTSPARTHTSDTANLLGTLSGPHHSPQHLGEKRKDNNGSKNDVDTKLKLGKRSLEGESILLSTIKLMNQLTKALPNYSEFAPLEKRARDKGEGSITRSSNYKQSLPEQRYSEKFSDSKVAVDQFKKDGHRVRGVLDIGVPSDKSAQQELPQIRIDHGHMTGHAVSWITGARTIAEKKVRFQLKSGKETYYRKPGKDVRFYTTRPYRAAFIETHSKHADLHTVNDVDKLLKQDQRLLEVKISDVHHHLSSDHTFPALHITPGQKKTRVTSAFFHREKPSVSKTTPEKVQPSVPHAGDKRNRDGVAKSELRRRSINRKIPSPEESVGIWKRGDHNDNPIIRPTSPKGFQRNLDEASVNKTSLQKIHSSVGELKQLKDQGHTVKGISNIGVHADRRETKPVPSVSIRDGRQSGHVLTWVMQHPERSSAKLSEQDKKSRTRILPSTSYHGPDTHVSGFVEVANSNKDPDGHRVSRGVYNLYRNGHLVTHTGTHTAKRDPNSPHKYPAIHVRPGNQHARVLSAFITPPKSSRLTTSSNPHEPSNHYQPEVDQTTNLIERFGSSSSPQHSASTSNSSSRSGSPDTRSTKKPRTDLRL